MFETMIALRPSRRTAALAASLFAAVLVALPVGAQDYPAKPVQIVVPLGPGTGVDLMARAFAQVGEQKFGQRLLVVNREGGGFTIAMAAVAAAPADGYTIAFTPHTPVTIQVLRMKNLSYKHDSFAPLCQTYDLMFFVATGPNSPYKDIRSVIEHAKANPGKLKYGTAGVGTVMHLVGAELWQRAGVQITDIPYKGEAHFAPNLLAGEIDLAVVTTSLVSSQKLRPLVVFSEKRLPNLPNLPTADELGFPVRTSGFGGVFVRAETPAPIVAKLESACRDTVADPSYRQVAERQFLVSTYLGRSAFAARVEAEYESKTKLLRSLNLPD